MNGENQMDPYLNLNNSGATNLMLGKNAVQEATVTTNAYGGQFGQQAGAQVSYVTKSGTNAYHGNANYWWTGRAMDANSWFAGQQDPFRRRPSTTTTRGPLRLADQSRRTSCSSSLTGKVFATSFLRPRNRLVPTCLCQFNSGEHRGHRSGFDSICTPRCSACMSQLLVTPMARPTTRPALRTAVVPSSATPPRQRAEPLAVAQGQTPCYNSYLASPSEPAKGGC